jgi:hypothetical protein
MVSMMGMHITAAGSCKFALPVPHRPDEPVISPVSPRILQGYQRPDRCRDPTDERDLEDQADDAGDKPAPEDKRQEWKKYSDQRHININ